MTHFYLEGPGGLPGLKQSPTAYTAKNFTVLGAGIVDFSQGTGNVLLPTNTYLNGVLLTSGSSPAVPLNLSGTSANALSVGQNGTTNPAFNVNDNTASSVTGVSVVSNIATSGVAIVVTSSGTTENLALTPKGTGHLQINNNSPTIEFLDAAQTTPAGWFILQSTSDTFLFLTRNAANTGFDTGITWKRISAGLTFMAVAGAGSFTANTTADALGVTQSTAGGAGIRVTSAGANALVVGLNGKTNPAFNVNAATASSVTGFQITSAAVAAGAALAVISSGTNENGTIAAKGTGLLSTLSPLVQNHTTAGLAAINSTATATAAQVATGYITSTSGAATTITLPTGTLLGAALGATQGTVFDLWIDNTAGANTVTIAVAVNGILNADAAANAASLGLLTIPSGVTGQGRFTLTFSSATAYTFARTA
jgi:hypothetical protein